MTGKRRHRSKGVSGHASAKKSKIGKENIVETLEKANDKAQVHAWLLVFSAIVEKGLACVDAIPSIMEQVYLYLNGAIQRGGLTEKEMESAERVLGIPRPCESVADNQMRTKSELRALSKKLYRTAVFTWLCAICAGLLSCDQFSTEELRTLCFDVNLTLAEIENGCTTYEDIEAKLCAYDLTIDREDDET